MSNCFSFRFDCGEHTARSNLVIYFEKKISLDAISREIKSDITCNLVPGHVYLITSDATQYTLDEITSDKAFASEFFSYVGSLQDKLTLLRGGTNGELLRDDGMPEDQNRAARIIHYGMLSLFKRHRGLIVSNNSYHFVKPSGDHCNSFIRASNLLVSSNEVSFLAISLLPYLKDNIKRIYIDTSSIAFLISIAIHLSGKYKSGFPSIESFESYTALNQTYDFVEDSSSLIIISATTSGSLANKLEKKTRLCSSNIITLFHLGLPDGQIGLFDIQEVILGGLKSSSASECLFCKSGSRLIHIQGEQFLPDNPKHELLLIRKKDFGQSRENFFKKYAATGTLEWNKVADSAANEKEHFFININKAVESNKGQLGIDFKKTINRYITRDLSHVILLEDLGSDTVFNEIDSITKIRSDQNIEISQELELDNLNLEQAGSVMVVASAITSGRKLLAVSRKLRRLNPSSSILYFVAFSKLPSKEAQEQLKKDLQQGGHTLVVLEMCPLPRLKEQAKTSWKNEYDTLYRFSNNDPLGDTTDELPEILQERLNILNANSASADDLFLWTPKKEKLKLRKTFAFWSDLDFDDERLANTTQADVYWTIQAILHDLRNNSENKGLATPYHTTLLSPANFDRFNDGIIQACLLRAALPVELDYRVDPVYSRQMTDVIISIFENHDNAQGEASLEFLMALWTERLKISSEHLAELKNKFSNISSFSEPMQFILGKLL